MLPMQAIFTDCFSFIAIIVTYHCSITVILLSNALVTMGCYMLMCELKTLQNRMQ